jgi:S-adenosylmethionine synthetase
MADFLFTSESVTEGHPDKIADQISDAILDDLLKQDKKARVACETLVTTGMAIISGEITTTGYADIPRIVRDTIKEIGYNNSAMGFDWQTCAVLATIDKQSPDIAQGVDEGTGLFKEQGAGDQGLMFGYACDETPELMPISIQLAHHLCKRLSEVRKKGILPFLRPDGKSQVTVEYKDDRPQRITAVVIAAQHNPEVSHKELKEAIIEVVVKPVIPRDMLDEKTAYFINATGRFVIGGPLADTGLTGRKNVVDTYGGWGHHGGGCFSGKDPSKVDRSASYMARYIAKNLVGARIAKKCEVQIAYAIGVPEPISLMVHTYGTAKCKDEELTEFVRKNFELTPSKIISYLDLIRPIYKSTAVYGHFGRTEEEFTWEKLDKVEEIADKLKKYCL